MKSFPLWRSIMHLIDAQDVSLYASNSNDTKTDPRSKRCGTTFQGHVEKKFPKGYERDLSEPEKGHCEVQGAIDELGAMRAGMYMLVWNAVLTKLMGDHPDQV